MLMITCYHAWIARCGGRMPDKYEIRITLHDSDADRLLEALKDAGLEKYGVASIEKVPATQEEAADWARRVREEASAQNPSRG